MVGVLSWDFIMYRIKTSSLPSAQGANSTCRSCRHSQCGDERFRWLGRGLSWRGGPGESPHLSTALVLCPEPGVHGRTQLPLVPTGRALGSSSGGAETPGQQGAPQDSAWMPPSPKCPPLSGQASWSSSGHSCLAVWMQEQSVAWFPSLEC